MTRNARAARISWFWASSGPMIVAAILLFLPVASRPQTPVQNTLLVKFTAAAFEKLQFERVDGLIRTGLPSLDALAQEFQLAEAARLFRAAGKNEARHAQFGLNRFFQFTFARATEVESLIQRFQHNEHLEFVQASRRYELHDGRKAGRQVTFTPNDPSFPSQWHYHNTGQTGGLPDADIDAPEAWDIETGDPSVIISDLDTGQDWDHPDLAANLWINPGEIAGNGVDDDLNGYIDDVRGWDFSNNDNNPDDYDGHGTHTAGTVAAVTNNGIGVAGVAFNAKVMPCKIFPNATDAAIAEAFTYAADNGARISTNSWGYTLPGPPSPVIEAAIDYFLATTNGVVVFSAGNNNSSDPTWGYPGSYPPVIAVAATDHNDHKASFSNYGSWVDVSAPGVNVLSTVIGGYASYSGTSMACPHVAGVAALVFAANPGFTGAQVRAQIEGGTDNIDALNPGFAGLLGSGRLNAYKALSAGPFPNPPANLQANVSGSTVQLSWDDPTTNTDGSPINLAQISVYRDGAEIAQVAPGLETYTDAGVADGAHTYFTTATNAQGEESSPSNTAAVLVGDIDVIIWLPNDVIDPNLAEKARERGLSEHEVRGMAHQPTSHLALQAALAANGKSSAVIADITTVDLTQFEAVCAVLGIFPNNHVVPANSAEALALVNYITGGGKVYLEGGDVWYWDPGFAGGHDFGPLFGITGLSDGTNDLATVQGVTGTFTAGLNFTYSGQNNYIDRLSPDAPAFTIHRNSSPVYDCGVAKSAADYRTIGTSYEFGGLADGASTKEELMAAYLDFLDLPTGPVDAVIWIPQEVLEPNLAEKAAQRGFTLPQVETLKVRITSHEALAAALEGNGKTVNVVNELTEASLAEAQYLFVVLGIYPNNHVIQNGDPEVPVIQNFMAAGGKVYMEGGDVWYYDPLQLNGFNFGPFFGITAEADGVNDLKTVYGSCAVEELDFVYEGTNNFIDHIAASAQACLFHSNFAPIYGCGVGHDPGTGARTIGNSFQFGGMADNSLSAATKTQLMQQYLQFFDTGLPACNLSVISPNGGESLTFGSVFEIQWTSANTSGLVKLELSTDGGASYSLIAGAETDDGSYHWTVPNVLSSNCLVRISDHADPGCVDVSDNPFSLVPSTEWLVPISVQAVASQSGGLPEIKAFDRSFGGHPSATNGYDPGLDIVAAPPGFTYYAYFSVAPPVSFLSRDIRGWLPPFNTDIDWLLVITNAVGITSDVSWDNTKFPAQGTFTLKGPGVSVNMRTHSSVQVTGSVVLFIEYRSEVCVTFDFPVITGAWYLVSLPVVPEDGSVNTLFPNAAIAFGWNYATQSYAQVTALEPEKAYWLLFLQASSAEVCGQPLESYTRNYAFQGWDLTGAVVETSPLIDNPDNSVLAMFGWNPVTGQYYNVNPFVAEPQQGYWILVYHVPSSITVGGTLLAEAGKPAVAGASAGDLTAFYQSHGALPPPPPFALGQHEPPALPKSFDLSQNFPNPFNPETQIAYQLPEAGRVTLRIYNMLGQPLRTLVEAELAAGYHKAVWNGKDDAGQPLPSGVYLYRLEVSAAASGAAKTFSQTRKIVLLK